MASIRQTYARCHAVLYKGYAEGSKKRTQQLALFRDLGEAARFFKEKQNEGSALQLFIEPPMLGGDFTSIDFGQDDL
jgi:hypothetical protein